MKFSRLEDMHLENHGVALKLKVNNAVFLNCASRDACFLKHLPPRRVLNYLTFFHLPAEAVPSPRTESDLLHPQKKPRVLVHKAKREYLFHSILRDT